MVDVEAGESTEGGAAAGRVVSVVLIEDHGPTSMALAAAIGAYAHRIRLVATGRDGASGLEAITRCRPSVALIDLRLPDVHGSELVATLTATHPGVASVILTLHDDADDVVRAVRAGAVGYVLKEEPVDRLVAAVEEAAHGGFPISARLLGCLFAALRPQTPGVSLTPRETELARALARGLTYAECAIALGIGVGTVQSYVKALYTKLDVCSKAEVGAWVTRYLEVE